MSVLRNKDVKKLSKQQASEKLIELEKSMLEIAGEGKKEKRKPLKQAVARLKTHIHHLELKENKEKKAAA